MAYRFKVGTKVLCRTGADEWSAGTIVAQNYREDHWPAGKTVPYQVALSGARAGTLIFVPVDRDQLCRALVPPWWAAVFDKPGSHYAKNPSADGLVQAGRNKDVNEQDHEGKTCLMEAAVRRWPNAVSQLISMKADLNIVDGNNSGALHRATAHGVCIIKLLVDAKADLNCQEDDPDHDPEWISTTFGARIEHWTPLHHVCSEGDAASAKVLLDAGAITDLQDAQLKTPLHLAIDADHGDCIDLLLSFGANVELGNNSAGADNSPLMEAAMAGKEELVKKLIGAKADVNKQGKQDMSALHLAARKRHARVAESLIAAKADMTQESKCGTALYLARKNGGADLLKVFGVEPLGDLAGVGNVITSVAKLDAAQQAALHLD